MPHLSHCASCGSTGPGLQRHHPDITLQPEWVIPLCEPCHRAADGEVARKRLEGGEPRTVVVVGPGGAPRGVPVRRVDGPEDALAAAGDVWVALEVSECTPEVEIALEALQEAGVRVVRWDR